MEIRRLSILGLGLLGGSLGLAVKNLTNPLHVTGYAHRKTTLNKARQTGAIDVATDDLHQAVAAADLIVLCTPVGIFSDLLRDIAPALKPGAIVTDVGSTKATVVADAHRLLPPTTPFVGSHPMAGSEKRGVDFANPALYQNALCILTPTPDTPPAATDAVDRFWQSLQMRTTRIPPDTHDRLLAAVSHLPHATAAALALVQPDGATALAGKGYLDSTRIAAGDPVLWRDIFTDNRKNLLESIRHLRDELATLESLLERNDPRAIESWLAKAAALRATVTPKQPSES